MAEEKTEAAAAPEPASAGDTGGGGGGSSKLVLILTAVNVLVTLGMVGILFVSLQKEKSRSSIDDIAVGAQGDGHGDAKKDGHGGDGHGGEGKKEEKRTADLGKMLTLEQFTVNLTTPGSVTPRFVRVNVSLELQTAETETEVAGKMPQVRNVIIDLFNSKRPADLQSAEGRDYLKEEIRNAINGFLVSGKVKGVFFTNFALSS